MDMLTRKDFYYELPHELIAQSPVDKRDESRLLVWNFDKKIEDKKFYDLPQLIHEKFFQNHGRTLCIVNDSCVYPARVRIKRQTGARGEVFLLETGQKEFFRCLLRPQSKLKKDEVLYADLDGTPLFRVTSLDPSRISLLSSETLDSILKTYGEMPLPPYIDRDPKRVHGKNEFDKSRYQTVYADKNKLGSAAAPTAGLHFTENIISECKNLGIEFVSVTLHVGLGTFAPVQADKLIEHAMHEEHYCISRKTYEKIQEYKINGWPIIYVGTTSLRTVESFYRHPPEWRDENVECWHSTKLFLYPKHRMDKIVPCVGQAILTNFHQPESTLAMLIASLVGYDFWKEIYSYAINNKYRFFSYGDSSLLIF